MNKHYPFDPSLKHHMFIALGLALWIFAFLYFTEPLDVDEFGDTEKLIYLPFYGLGGAISYLMMMPVQRWIWKRSNSNWYVKSELLFLVSFVVWALIVTRSVYLYVVMVDEPNPYSFGYYIGNVFFPAISVLLPIVIIGRWAFGKYREKQYEDQKIEIQGEGTYEGLRIFFNDLICVKADDNYVEVSYSEHGELKKQLIRNRLTKISESFPELLRTHRSYLINPYHFKQYKNASGKLSLVLHSEIEVPVSKSYSAAVKEAIPLATK
ncbi:LytTR family DNA-binding domain-containing protein [Aureisphaera galaxeae]|uniref:LytTR family DNA-binding domain-containing protein n=1 Tax=Aureisphaera galaxeae TaxID=1538023 RepID=UPI0023502C93|nr:LytTR family DNA-binding domain-containing protein [Aureisphaera galaxeae]MDC8004373.1 LytTR family DNA-binding domain-containing protein [Aureisphaera galaxeae]